MVETPIDPRRLEAALADPRLVSLAAGPLILAAGAPLRLLYATPAALRLFRAANLTALTARLLEGGEPGARRLVDIAASLAPDSPRLERLRFFLGGGSEALTFQCLRLAGADGLFAAAAIGVRPALLDGPPLAAPGRQAPAQPEAAPQATRRNVRFLWRTDADLRFTMVDSALCDVLGRHRADLIGSSFLELARDAGLDPDGTLRAALSRRETWSGVRAVWKAPSGAAVPMTWGALPLFDQTQGFAGFSGFGVAHMDASALQATVVAEATPIAQPLEEQLVEAQPQVEQSRAYEAPAEQQASHAPAAGFRAPNVVALSAWKSSTALAPAAFTHVAAGDPPGRDAHADNQPAGGLGDDEGELVRLTPAERNAFRDIARALGARMEEAEKRRAHREAAGPLGGDSEDEPMEQQPAVPGDWDAARKLLDRVDAPMMICRGGEAVFLNRALLGLLGHDTFASYNDAGGLGRMFRGRAPDDERSAGAVAVTTRNGDMIALEGKLQGVEWDGGPATLTTFRKPSDCEASARAEALALELAAQKARAAELTAILDVATDGVATLDASGRIERLNASAEALLGYAQNEAAGDAFTLLLAPESHHAAVERLAEAAQDAPEGVFAELTGRRRDGSHLPLSVRIARVGEDRFCAVMRDASSWKRAEHDLVEARRQAEHASALKSDFLAKISHEIRTPLNAIIGFAEVILEERFGPIGNDRYKDYLKDIHASGAHVMSLVNDLLDLSKIEAGKLELHVSPVDANRIVSECVSMMQAQALRERVIVRVSLAPQASSLLADERALRQIVLNLLSNAVKFNQPGGQVIVSTALTEAGAFVLRVRDTGVGMSEADIETALEPFRQIRSARQTPGTGLGLPLTKALVEAHRASFTITSGKGEGTLVEIAFPPEKTATVSEARAGC